MHLHTDIKKLVTAVFLILSVLFVKAQPKYYDPVATLIIDRMTAVISDMESCSFRLSVADDVYDPSAGWVKRYTDYEVYISGPSRMLINARGYKGHRQLWYNGKELACYSYDENNYGIIQMPGTTLKMIDSLHSLYDIEFPAADFFYPAFTDDLFEEVDSVKYMGVSNITSKDFFHVLAYGKEKLLQFWLSNDGCRLPAKFAITYRNKPGNPQYIASFSDWQVNPHLPEAMFYFLPPPGATRVRMVPTNGR